MSPLMSIALRRASSTASNLFPRVFADPAIVLRLTPCVYRSFNTDTQMTNYDDGSCTIDAANRSVSSRCHSVPSFFSDALDPFSPQRSLSQVLNLMDQFIDNPFVATSQGISRRAWDVREDENALFLRMDVPGLGKDDVRVLVEQNTLIVKCEERKEADDEDGRRFSSRLDIPSNLFKRDSIRAEMKNGVLKIMVPKVKQEERNDVFQVKID